MSQQFHIDVLHRFLSFPLTDGADILALFATLPGAIAGTGKASLQRYVFVPGSRKDAVVLVAHIDTVWDHAYGKAAQTSVTYRDGAFYGANPTCGIGADDRAGCAMLWALRDCGHSLLLVDGEEKGKWGAKYLRNSNPKLFRKLNHHRFMIELDWRGTGGCLYNQVENTQAFKEYISSTLGFHDDKEKGGCDLQVLCRNICGVNIGIGYHDYHRPTEHLVVSEWEETLNALSDFLQKEHPKFPIPVSKQIRAFLRRCKAKCGSILRKLHLRK